MDFLREIKAQLEEIERAAQQRGTELFPDEAMLQRGQAGPRPGRDLRHPEQGQGRRQPRQGRRPPGRGEQPSGQARPVRQQQQGVSSAGVVGSEVEEVIAQREHTAPVGERPSILDDLSGRLEEAFLLQEILGPPRCMRELE